MRKRNLFIPVLLMIMQYSVAVATSAAEETVSLRDLVPNESRWFRGLTFKAYRLDQPNTLFDSEQNPTPNPNPELEKYELSLDLAKMFWSSDELVDAYKLAASAKSLIDAESFEADYLPGTSTGKDVLAFFARAQKGQRFRCFASAFTLSMAQSERQNPGPGDEYEGTYGVVFDPKKWIVTADRALKAYEGLNAYIEVQKEFPSNFMEQKKDGVSQPIDVSRPTSALKKLSGLPIMSQGLVALIPAIEFKSVDQFDFLTAGGSTFFPSPLIEGSIETVTLTWDFSAALDTTKKRRSAMRAIAMHKEIVERHKEIVERLTPKILPKAPEEEGEKREEEKGEEEKGKVPRFCVGDFLYLQFTREPAVKGARWSGRNLPEGLVLQRNGFLRGYFEKEGHMKFTIAVKARDEEEVESERAFKIEVCNSTDRTTHSGEYDRGD